MASYYYRCAQAERRNKSRKGLCDGVKLRDKGSMEKFACNGWLKIKVYEGSPYMDIKVGHHEEHIPYWCIDVPSHIWEFVEKNYELTITQVHHIPLFFLLAQTYLFKSSGMKFSRWIQSLSTTGKLFINCGPTMHLSNGSTIQMKSSLLKY